MKTIKTFLIITISFIILAFINLFIKGLMIRAIFGGLTGAYDIEIVDDIAERGAIYLMYLPVKLFVAQLILSWFYGKRRIQKWNIGHGLFVLLIGVACSFLPYILLGYI